MKHTWLILIGILINAAAPPVSAWLADAYPESSPTGSVFLSAYTTKTAVLALILLFPGEQVLIWVGLYMIMYGIIYALLENDARRILAYSIVNQVGFMVCAIGIGTEMALNGAAAHAFAHIMYKALLFMSAGVVLYRTGKSKCTDLGGLFRTMPITTICGIVGALSISSFPLTSGFTTKTMISTAATDEGMMIVYFPDVAGHMIAASVMSAPAALVRKPAHLLEPSRVEALPPEAGLHCHHQHQVHLRQDRVQHLHWRGRIQGDTGHRAVRAGPVPGEVGQVRLPENDGAGLTQSCDDSRVVVGDHVHAAGGRGRSQPDGGGRDRGDPGRRRQLGCGRRPRPARPARRSSSGRSGRTARPRRD